MISKKSFSFIFTLPQAILQQSKIISKSIHSIALVQNKNQRNVLKSIQKPSIKFNFVPSFTFNTYKFNQSMIQSIQQYHNGCNMLEKGQYPIAVRQFQMALKFLPKNLEGDTNYKNQYEGLLKKLLEAHVFMNKPILKFRQLYNQYIDKQSKFNEFLKVIEDLDSGDLKKLQTIQTQDKLWKQLVRVFSFKYEKECFGKHLNIEKVAQSKDLALRFMGLYLFQKIKNRTRKDRQDIYLNACRQLLKQTQQFQPQNIVKPLSLMASNFLAGDQYLQAQGMMSYCLTTLQQFHSQNPSYLKTDQQYIMCKLLIARVFEGVNRKMQSQRIQEQFGKLFDQKKFIIQELLQVSYRQL